MRYLLLPLLAVALLALGSCSDEQIARAQSLADLAQARLAQAEKLVATAGEAVAQAQAAAEQLQSAEALRVVNQAKEALVVVSQTRDGLRIAADSATKGVEAMKGAQATGQGSIGVLTAFAGGVVPGILAAIPFIMRAFNTGRALAQTVSGVAEARKALGEPAWKASVAPALEKHQDADVKARVAKIAKKKAA